MTGDTEGIDLCSVSTSSSFKSSGTFSGKRKIILASANPRSARPTPLQREHYVRIVWAPSDPYMRMRQNKSAP